MDDPAVPPKKLYRTQGRPRKPRPSEIDANRTKEKWEGAFVDPGADDERVAELARLGPAFDGHVEVGYEKESPPIPKRVKTWLEGELFPAIPRPASPGVYCLWHKDRIVYVGSSSSGIFADGWSAHVRGPQIRYGVDRKIFDRISFRPLSEEFMHIAARALIRLLHPKYNKTGRRSMLEEQDIRALQALGYDGLL
jgi:hypothetical protein